MIRWRIPVAGLALAATAGVAVLAGHLVAPRPVASREAAPPPPVASREAAATPSFVDTSAAPTQTPTPAVSPTTALSAIRTAQEQRQRNEAALTAALQRYDDDIHADLALTVVNRNTGRIFSYNGRQRFETASIVKVDILAALLLQAEDSRRPLTASEKSLASAMIERSDNGAATALWNRAGGISRSVDVFGLTATAPDAHGRWGVTTTTAADQARLMNLLADPTGPVTDADYLFGLMRNVAASQSWGIRAAARPGEAVAVKNGWMPEDVDNGRWTVNSMGRITDGDTDVTIVVLSRGHASLQAGIDLVEVVATLARTYLEW